MHFLHNILEKQKPLFEKRGKLERFYYLFEAAETFAFTPPTTTAARGVQIRDAIDLKRMMITVVVAMVPCLLFGIWNVGYQHNLATGAAPDLVSQLLIGSLVVLPVVLVSYTAGGLVEVVFAITRKHPINEGFLVTGMLVPLVMPPTIPLWQVALATIFAVLIAKEAFGGTGMNVLNVAMTARAFLYFAYPSDISGEVWTYLGDAAVVDGYTGATALAIAANASQPVGTALLEATAGWGAAGEMFTPLNMLIGTIPGSIGETSALMALVGAIILIATGVASWRIIVGCVLGALLMGGIFNAVGYNAFMSMPAHWHLIMGGFAFGAVFMATDPVSAAHTETGKWIYGIFIGLLTVLIRVFNPAYPEGIMLAVLLMNVFAPLIDFYVVEANKKRRLKRATL
ncbi:MAG: NADH:ubiquinone reductase (Na(+)-transporting) subunit B [Bernardetiaceae bacterium]